MIFFKSKSCALPSQPTRYNSAKFASSMQSMGDYTDVVAKQSNHKEDFHAKPSLRPVSPTNSQ